MSIDVIAGPWLAAIRPLPEGTAVAAIGDVHGEADLLAALHAAIAREFATVGARAATLIHLGDLVDRGPHGRRALRLARAGIPGAATVTLTGNHEDRLVAMLDPAAGEPLASWLQFGGEALVAELGIRLSGDWRAGLAEGLGPDLVAFLRALPTSHRIGDLLFVHAGIEPALPLAAQTREAMIWIRGRFSNSPGPYAENVAVVHGHTPVRAIDLGHPHRINLDSGAFATGVLSALVVAGERMRLVQARQDG
jgi:serine/threonine protein phosphatase 1